MSNVPLTTSTKDTAAQARVLAETLPDAGMKSLDHYSRRLPPWRYRLRKSLLPIVRWETPHLAKIQQTWRTPFLDSYFAMTANLGTHTFFLAALPICFWCGYTSVGRALVHMLALGVFWSGWIKDLLCLPRPLSPPLQRITMSGSAALEYGFPSTHSTNAVSVAVYFLYQLHTSLDDLAPSYRALALFVGYSYALSIIAGRMYCGMHGFFDVIVGSALGMFLAVLQLAYGIAFDHWIAAGSWTNPAIAIVVVLLAVRFHPEPADNCPCFDDSVAFAGVMIGIQLGHWHFAGTSFAVPAEAPATVYFYLSELGWFRTAARIIGGVVVIFLWRATMKRLLLRCLPPIFRFAENAGVILPRRFFTRASEYKRVPPLRKDDNVIPYAADIPQMFSSMRHPRKRGISVGPQSEADAREFIAYREHKRRMSRSAEESDGVRPQLVKAEGTGLRDGSVISAVRNQSNKLPTTSDTPPATPGPNTDLLAPSPFMAQPLTPPTSDSGSLSDAGKEDEEHDHRMFMALEKPRVRYDVEVVTKLVVYAGIAWLAVEGNPILFEYAGVGMRSVL